ncbi:MAG: Transglycosylase associated protein [Thermoleophilia bacterium]|nr:Transglycosylase associated protein [Thermoleophilia bacterium]
MGIIAFLLLGVIAGAIAKALMPGNDGGGFFLTMVLGVIGAVVGGFLAAALFDAHPMDEFFDLSTWACAIVGSIIVLAVYRMTLGSGDRSRV